MKDYICIDKRFSTTKRLFKGDQALVTGASVPLAQQCRGGLRLQGYSKRSSEEIPLVTVVTVVYNDAEGLRKTIESVIGQTYDNIEYIVIDGGSTDSTLMVIGEYEDKIDYWQSEPDRGIYDAMNKGVELAAGEWLNFMNARDAFYEQDTVEKVFRTAPRDADFIFGHTYFLGGDFNGVVKVWDFDILWKTMVFTHQSLFTRRTLLKIHPFDTRFKICADYNIIFSAYMDGRKFFNTGEVIAYFSPGKSDFSRARMAYEKWKVVRRYRSDLQFHWFYLKLFCKRLLHDVKKRLSLKS